MCSIKMEKYFRSDSCYCQLFKGNKIGTLIRILKSTFIYLAELIMSWSCLNYFLNHKLFTGSFAITIHYNLVTCQSKFKVFLSWIQKIFWPTSRGRPLNVPVFGLWDIPQLERVSASRTSPEFVLPAKKEINM